MIVVGGSASKALSKKLATELKVKLAEGQSKRFPDDELYVRIMDKLDGEEVLLVQSAYPDRKIIELFLLQNAILEAGAEKLTTVIPYYGYARQDKKFNDGEAVSAKALAGHFELDCDEIITVDLHSPSILDWFDVPATEVSALPQISKYLGGIGVDIVVSPGKGGFDRARLAADTVGCEFDYLETKRINSEHIEIKPKSLAVNGKTVAIVDDIIATGSTILEATKQLKAQGASKVYAVCTHGLFLADSLKKLKENCSLVVSTDTIENETSLISVAPEIAKAIK